MVPDAEPGQTPPGSSAPPRQGHHALDLIVGETPAIGALRLMIGKLGAVISNVLITGESGTGKELVARAIHASSARASRPFMPVNCGAIPPTLLESELFGHVRGAFTSAVTANRGLFIAADQGTLFLDEIGELPLALQVKLLRAIEEGEVWPVGATASVTVDVRIIAATNRTLQDDVDRGRFRKDLYYRLNVVHVGLPPLRERRADIPLIAERLLSRLNARLGTTVRSIDPATMQILVSYQWRGNVRELENVLERSMLMGDGAVIRVHDLPEEIIGS
jgi:transcriptional regulator with PAS, ATPase and Fis domain